MNQLNSLQRIERVMRYYLVQQEQLSRLYSLVSEENQRIGVKVHCRVQRMLGNYSFRPSPRLMQKGRNP